MSRVKKSSKRKRLAKAAALPAFGAAGMSLSLMGGASASALPFSDVPQSLNTGANQRFVLSEEEMADVSLATFHLFDRENGTAGLMQVARGCGCGGCHGCGGCGHGCGGCGHVGIGCGHVGIGCRGCGCRGCGCGGCVGVGLGILGLGLLGGCGGCGVGWGGCGYGGCCASWGVCRLC